MTTKSETRPPPRVTHAELQAELARLREAIAILGSQLGANLSPPAVARINDLLAAPEEREPPC